MNFEKSSGILENTQSAVGHCGKMSPPISHCDFCGAPNHRSRSRYCSVRCNDRAYRRRIPHRRSQQNRKYRVKNRARIRRNQKLWRTQNPNYNRDYYAKRRNREIARALAGKILRRLLKSKTQ